MHTLKLIDLIMVVILGLSINSGRKSDLGTELVILAGVLIAASFSLHYYVRLGSKIAEEFVVPSNTEEVLAFTIINGIVIGLVILAKGGWLVMLKFKLDHRIDNWGSLILSVFRSYFLCSIVLFALVISGYSGVSSSAKHSYSFLVFRKGSLWPYSTFYTAFIGPFFKEEPLNEKAFRVMQNGS